jgi:hypothetical protein
MLSNLFQAKLPEECKQLKDVKVANVIVSLTSYPPRFATLHKTIASILQQSIQPKRLCLWIAENDISSLPRKVKLLAKFGLEIIPTHDIKSFKKFIPCFLENENEVIVTADDDVYYPKDWLRTLYAYHLKSPDNIICHRARQITVTQDGSINSYNLWPYITEEMASIFVFPIGNGGVLYPPDSFHPDIGREEVFSKICKYGDDIWFKAMSLHKMTICKKINYYHKNFRHVRNSQKTTLNEDNMSFRNDEQILSVFTHYNTMDILR